MRDYGLGFISNENIYLHVKETVLQYRVYINLNEFNRNIIDPIKLTFDSKVYGKNMEEIIESECIRQIDKTNSNHIGYFHQKLFNYAGRGWHVPRAGFDIVNDTLHIYAELKNKHNTMNAASAKSTYIKMQNQLLHDDQAVCMLVEVIARKSQNEKWNITMDNQTFSHDRIRRVSIDKFYGLVFNDSEAFMRLCKVLPDILDDVIVDLQRSAIQNDVYSELRQVSPDIAKSLYLLAFRSYDGFQNF